MVVQARQEAANLNMFIIPHLGLIPDLDALEAHSFSWQLRLKELVSCQCARGQSAVLRPVEMQITLVCRRLAGWLLRSGPVLTCLTWLFFPLSSPVCSAPLSSPTYCTAIHFLCVFVISGHIFPSDQSEACKRETEK